MELVDVLGPGFIDLYDSPRCKVYGGPSENVPQTIVAQVLLLMDEAAL